MLQVDLLEVTRTRRSSIIRHSGVRSVSLSCLLRRAATEGSYTSGKTRHFVQAQREASVADTLGLLDTSEAPMDLSSVLVHEYAKGPVEIVSSVRRLCGDPNYFGLIGRH